MKKTSILLVLTLLGWLTANGQQLVSENVFKDITTLAHVRNTRFARPSPAGKLRKTGKPVAFYIGDSTMRTLTDGNGWSGEWGFGLFAQEWFDANELVVENHALGGTSSRTFYNDEWPKIKKGIKADDYVVISFGHNDGGNNWDSKSTISGTSTTDTKVVTNKKGVKETVYSYGQYLRLFVDETLALGATPILCSRTPRGSFSNGKPTLENNYRQWSKAIAQEKGVAFIDIEGVSNPIFAQYGEWKVKQLYYNGTLHTSLLGAYHNAYCAALSIATDETNPLNQYLQDTTPPKLQIERKKGLPYTFNVDDENTSARDMLRSGKWSLIYNTLEKGDTVFLTFGSNELRSTTEDGEMGCIQSAEEAREVMQMKLHSRWEVVGSYGWYIHYFLNDIKEKGAIGVLVNDKESMPAEVIEWNEVLAQRYNALLFTKDIADMNPEGPIPPISEMEKLTRGVVVLPSESSGQFISWRMLGTDPLTTTFDVLRDGQTIARNLGNRTNFTDPLGTSESEYQIVVKVDGDVVETTEVVKPWSDYYQNIKLDRPAGGIYPYRQRTYDEYGYITGWTDYVDTPYSYYPQECSVGDIDGDGEYELFVKWSPSNQQDNSQRLGKTGNVYLDCYRMDGTKLWRVDLGINIRAGACYTQFLVYDFDGDGCAEMICKTAPGSIDGAGRYVSQAADDATIQTVDNNKDWRTDDGKIVGGQEYLTVFDGYSGHAIHTVFYNPNRNTGYGGEADGSFDWSDTNREDKATYGNRGERYLAAVAYLDGKGQRPSAIMCRGYYSYAFLWAVDFDGEKLSTKWLHASKTKRQIDRTGSDGKVESRFYSTNTFGTSDSYTAYGQGNHQMAVADVDMDGYDEIIYGAATIDHDGWLLYTTGLGHGDRLHVGDLLPDRPGLEVFRCIEASPYGCEIHDARTGEKLYHRTASGDTGAGMAADIDGSHRGYEFWASDSSVIINSTFEPISYDARDFGYHGFRIYWDGDLQDECFYRGRIDKWSPDGKKRIYLNGKNFYQHSSSSYTDLSGASLQADLFGDWREEMICWNGEDSASVNLFTTNIPSLYRVPTLMHDHYYRLSIARQNVCYNQMPMLGYYLPDADFSYPGELTDESAPDLTGYELSTELDFGSMADTYITTNSLEQRGTAWEDGNQRQQKIYNTTLPTDFHDILAFQMTYSGSGTKGWWISKRAGGLVSEYAHRSAAILGLKKGDIVIFETTNSVDGTLTLTDGNGNPDGSFTFTRSGDASKYYCTMTSNGQLGFCAEWRYTGAIKKIQIYRKKAGGTPSGITNPSIQQNLPTYQLNGIPSVGIPIQHGIYIIGNKKVIIRKNR